MKKHLTFGILLLLSLTSHAVHLSKNNMGEVLIFPYYTVNGGFNTLINLTNATNQAKALRVRFREAANAREVYSFNLYLGPNDVWVGGLVKNDVEQGNVTQLISQDQSCTVPILNNAISPNLFYQNNYLGEFEDGYGTASNRLHEGFIEVIEMGVLTGDSAASTLMDHDDPQLNCQRLQNAWSQSSENNYWFNDSQVDMLPPSGGISGHLILVDVVEGISISQDPTVLEDFSEDILHFNSGDDSPSLANSKTTSNIEQNGGSITLEWPTGFEAVTSVLMTSTLSNEYALDQGVNAKTDWIITLPTKHYHLDEQYTSEESIPVDPFSMITGSEETGCQSYGVAGLFNRESDTPGAGSLPPPPGGLPPMPEQSIPAFCYAANNLHITQESDQTTPVGIFGSNFPAADLQGNQEDLVVPYRNGWFELDFSFVGVENELYRINGLPVIGFATQQYTNSNAQPGLLAQYAGNFEHKKQVIVERLDEEPLSSEQAMQVANDNVGQVLIYPYYSVRNDLNSLVTVVNTTDQVKALKIRFLEGKNSREVLDFNLYLAAYDVWTAGLVYSESTLPSFEGQPTVKILTNDNSCTVPVINNQEFLPYAFTGDFNDGLNQDMSRVTEGSVEILEMGTVIGDDADAATHILGTPQDCQQLINNWTAPNGKWIVDSSVNIIDPDGSGGLYGSMSLIDVQKGIDMSYDASAIVNFNTDEMHAFPGDLIPNLSSGNNSMTAILTNEGLLETRWVSPLAAVTALFMQEHISNDYSIEEPINAETEWVNFFPTKNFHIDPFWNSIVPGFPFTMHLNENGACEDYIFSSYNREQERHVGPPRPPVGIVPPGGIGEQFPSNCWSINVADINSGTNTNSLFDSLLASRPGPGYENARYDDLTYQNGWMQQDFVIGTGTTNLIGLGANGDKHWISGLPVIGFVAQKYTNGNSQPGLLANYGVITMNKSKRKIRIFSSTTQ